MSLFTRLFLLLALLTGVSLAAVGVLLQRKSMALEKQLVAQNADVGQKVRQKGEMLVGQSIRVTHTRIIAEKARKVENFFAEVGRAVELEASLAGQFLNDPEVPEDAPLLIEAREVVRRRAADPDFRDRVFDARPYAIYHLAPGVKYDDVSAPMNRLRRLGVYFAHTRRTLAGCDSPYLGDARGFILGYPGGGGIFPVEYDPRKRPWYLTAMQARRLTWSVYVDKDPSKLIVTASTPIRQRGRETGGGEKGGGEPTGVAAIDVRLAAVVDELFTVGDLQVSDAILIDEQDRVRVRARFTPRGATYDTDEMIRTPPVETLDDAGFSRTVRQIKTGVARSGVSWDDDSAGGVYIFAAVELLDSYGEDAAPVNPPQPIVQLPGTTRPTTFPAPATRPSPVVAKRWHYIVRLPKESINQPAVAVASQIDGATQDISAAIESGASASARALFVIIVVALSAALTLAWFGARRTARPLVQMAHVARRIGEGDLDQSVDVQSRDEIGQLGNAINAMIVGLKQRNLLKETFGQYVAPAVVNQVLSKGGAELGGVRRTVTIFFSDLKGFTTLSEQLEPETLILLLNEYFQAMTKIILDSEGTLDKYVGDAIVAFWGEPAPHDDDPLRACRAALAQLRRLDELRPGWEARGLPHLDVRIGIETGPAIVGNVGSELKLNYTVLGDTANFASRLEGINKTYGTRILIGQSAYAIIGDAIEAREIDRVAVVGKEQSVRIYELLGMKGEVHSERLEGYRTYETALAAYRRQAWDEAEHAARAAIRSLGGDRPSEVLLERIADYRLRPPATDWDGTYVATRK